MLRTAAPWITSAAIHAALGLSIAPGAAPEAHPEPAATTIPISVVNAPAPSPTAPKPGAALSEPRLAKATPRPAPGARRAPVASVKTVVSADSGSPAMPAATEETPAPTPPVEAAAAPPSTAGAVKSHGPATSDRPPGAAGPPASVHLPAIHEAIRRHTVYPRAARKMGWSGRVLVGFRVLPGGAVSSIRVVQSSGVPALDESAVESVRRAAPLPGPAEALDLVVPVSYELLGD